MARFSNPAAQFGITKFTVSPIPGVGQYTTIQEAVTAANAAGGGTVAIYPGSYSESINWHKNISVLGASFGGVSNLAIPLVEIIGNQTFDEDGEVFFENVHLSSASGTTYTINASSTNVSTASFFHCYIESTSVVLQSSSALGTSNILLENCYIFSDSSDCIQSSNGSLSVNQSTVYSTGGTCVVLGNDSFGYLNNCFIESTTNYAVNINSVTAVLNGNNSHYKTVTSALPCWYYSLNGSATSWGENFESDDVSGFYISTAAAGLLSIGSQTITGTAININANLSIALYPAGSANVSSFICTGQAAFGTNAFDPDAEMVIESAVTPQAVRADGQIATVDGSNDQAAFYSAATMQPSAGSTNSVSFYSDTQFASPPAQTIANATDFFASPRYTSNVGTITNYRGFYFDGGGSGAGTITNAYGGFFANPSAGTNQVALYAANQAVGFTGVSPPSNGLIVNGRAIFGASSGGGNNSITVSTTSLSHGVQVIGTQTAVDGSSHQHSFSTTGTFSPTSGSVFSTAYNANSTFASPAAQTIGLAASYFAQPLYTGNAGTITTAAGFYFNGGGAGAGTITNSYGGYFTNPTAGTNKIALFSDNLNVGYSNVAPPASGAIISGSVAIGASSETVSAALAVTSTTKGFLPPSMTKTQKNAISSPATGLTVYDNTVNSLQIYNGVDWTYALGDYVSTAISYSANPGDYIIAVSNTGAARTITLPAVANLDEGKIYTIKDTSGTCGTNALAITVATTTGTIDGASNYLITQNYGWVTLAHDGTNFFVIAEGPTRALISTSSTSFNLAANNSYATTSGSNITAALPSTAKVGDTITILQTAAGEFTISQGASQLVRFGTLVTTTGTGGSIKSSQQGCSITIQCVVANTTYQVVSSIGNFLVT